MGLPTVLDELEAYGWNARWAAAFTEAAGPGAVPGRVVRHDGVALLTATPHGVEQLPIRTGDSVTVGDWVVITEGVVSQVLPRRSLMRRRDPDKDVEQLLAANVDLVVIVCGLDRPVKDGRTQRAVLLARDAESVPLIVLTKADLVEDPASVVADVEAGNPGVDVLVVAIPISLGIPELARTIAGRTVVLLGESGAGKSTLTNALAGEVVAATGEVRRGDAKGRHTTTTRELYPLPSGGVIIDSPGIRSVGVWGDPAAVAATFTDVAAFADQCRFTNCRHETEPGCAVREAVDRGELAQARLDAWRSLAAEARKAEESAEITARRARRGGGRR